MNVPKPIFEERLSPSWSVIIALSMSGPMVLLSALPFGPTLAFTLAFAVPLALILGAFYLSPMIVVNENFSRGKFEIPLSALGGGEVFRAEQARLERGPRLDANAKLAIRGDIDPVVKISVIDPQDPTPYILVSTRRPDELVAALRADRT
jgi:hypothetical protein